MCNLRITVPTLESVYKYLFSLGDAATEQLKTHGVSLEDFGVTNKRVENLEMSIATIVSRIDAVLQKMEAMEKAKAARREALDKLLRAIIAGEQQQQSSGAGGDEGAAATSDPEVTERRAQLKQLVAEELEELDDIRKSSASGTRPGPSGSGERPGTAARPPTSSGARPPTSSRPAW